MFVNSASAATPRTCPKGDAYGFRRFAGLCSRFLQPDPIGYGDGMNMYAYVGGDPVNFTDAAGLFARGDSLMFKTTYTVTYRYEQTYIPRSWGDEILDTVLVGITYDGFGFGGAGSQGVPGGGGSRQVERSGQCPGNSIRVAAIGNQVSIGATLTFIAALPYNGVGLPVPDPTRSVSAATQDLYARGLSRLFSGQRGRYHVVAELVPGAGGVPTYVSPPARTDGAGTATGHSSSFQIIAAPVRQRPSPLPPTSSLMEWDWRTRIKGSCSGSAASRRSEISKT
jgi:hypothetical protein